MNQRCSVHKTGQQSVVYGVVGLAGAVYTRGQNRGSAGHLAEPGSGADALQRPLVLRSRFRARLTASVRRAEPT